MSRNELKPVASNRAQKRKLRGPGDRGTRDGNRGAVTKVTRSTHYKGRRMRLKKDTLKTLKRATHLHRPCSHLNLRFFFYGSRLYYSIWFNLLYLILFINKVHFYLLETVWHRCILKISLPTSFFFSRSNPDHYQILSVNFKF